MSESEPILPPEKSEEELARIAKAAKEAKTMIIVVAAIALGGLVFMFLFTIVLIALTWD
jgi:hypothetical protein